ncbi:MAG: Gfo/Idh/MocA family oxidoreductase [Bacteroidaceae bacterium]|nr:Gfo/Idh/MocA family oxidoreductase [Bacteroidaceae bacterium]
MSIHSNESRRPVSIVAIGAGNRTNKYLEYVKQHPDKVKLVGVVELNDIRRKHVADCFSLDASQCFVDYRDFFQHPVEADAVMICTPENMHFEPTMQAIERGYHILLEKPIAQTLEECMHIAQAARKHDVLVSVCHVLRYHPYFMKIKELVDSGELGNIISINHRTSVGLDRTAHGFVRGLWRKEAVTNPMLMSKCCHDIDFLLWLTKTPCRKLTSFGSLRWFKEKNAPEGSAARCVDCKVESRCPFSAVDLYRVRRDWIANFDVPEGKTIDEVIEEQLRYGLYGRCVYRCDNDVVDHQIVSMEMESEVTINFSMDVFTVKDNRETHICLTEGEIDGDETRLKVCRFRGAKEEVYDFSDLAHQPFHAGADLNIVADFIDAIQENRRNVVTSIEQSVESHRICFEAERSRKEQRTILFG